MFPFILTKKLTPLECPSRVLIKFPVIISHIFIVLSLALAIVFPFILTKNLTLFECPSRGTRWGIT